MNFSFYFHSSPLIIVMVNWGCRFRFDCNLANINRTRQNTFNWNSRKRNILFSIFPILTICNNISRTSQFFLGKSKLYGTLQFILIDCRLRVFWKFHKFLKIRNICALFSNLQHFTILLVVRFLLKIFAQKNSRTAHWREKFRKFPMLTFLRNLKNFEIISCLGLPSWITIFFALIVPYFIELRIRHQRT